MEKGGRAKKAALNADNNETAQQSEAFSIALICPFWSSYSVNHSTTEDDDAFISMNEKKW